LLEHPLGSYVLKGLDKTIYFGNYRLLSQRAIMETVLLSKEGDCESISLIITLESLITIDPIQFLSEDPEGVNKSHLDYSWVILDPKRCLFQVFIRDLE